MGKSSRDIRWIWAVLWALSIFATSSGVVTTHQLSHAVSGAVGGRVSESGFLHFWKGGWWIFVKGWHACEFGILYLLLRRATPKWAALLAGSYAFLDEAHQLLVPSRGSRLSDVTIDCLGILFAWFLTEWVTRRERRYPAIFSHRWMPWVLVAAWFGLLFLLSIYPFGLVTLHPNPSRQPGP